MSEYKKISNFGTPDYADEPRYERKNGQWVDTKADIIKELEKIKAEIEGYKSTIDNAISEDELKIEGMKEAYADTIKIIDKHIAELKGENNENSN